MPEKPLPSMTPAWGILRKEAYAPVAILVAEELFVTKPAAIIPFNSAFHSEAVGTLNPFGQGLFTPPSVLFQGCTFQTPPVWEFQSACDVQG